MVEQLGTPGCRHVLSAGSFENTRFWNNFFFFCVKDRPAGATSSPSPSQEEVGQGTGTGWIWGWI